MVACERARGRSGGANGETFDLPFRFMEFIDEGSVFSIGTSVDGVEARPDWSWKTRVGDYFIRLSAESGYIGGCINREVPHVGFMIHRINPTTGRGTQIFNGHIAAWYSGSQWCAGVYESRTGWCRTTCFNPNNMLEALTAVLVAMLATYFALWLAQMIAAAMAAGAIVGLTLIPGVPPPP